MPVAAAILAFACGAIAGSFVAVVADRWPRGEDFVRGRSRCRDCGSVLRPADLVPVLSFLAARGRCRQCHARLPRDLVVAELLGGGIGVLALAASPAGLAGAALLAVFGWALLLLAMLDARHFWLPDALTLPLTAAGLTAGLILPVPTMPERALGAALGYAMLQAVRLGYRRLRGREGLGGGDPKLMAALGAWLGAAALPAVLLGAALVGLVAVALVTASGRRLSADAPLPFGTLLAIAGVAAMAFSG